MKNISILIFIVTLNITTIHKLSADIESGLIAHWNFDHDTHGIIKDQSDNIFNGTAYNISYKKGPIGNAAVFNSPNDRIYIPDSSSIPPKQISDLKTGSISLWFKYQSVGGNILPIFYYGESETNTAHNSLIIEIGHSQNPANRRLYFTIVNQKFCYDSGENLEEDRWYHFVAVVSNNGNSGYLNGKPLYGRHYNLGSDSTYSDFFVDVPTNELLAIGYGRYGREDPFFTFKGGIDDVRIYNRTLSARDVEELYQLGEVTNEQTATYKDVSYGPEDRNLLDFWKAESDKPAPVVVFIHGGGFRAGDKTQAIIGRNLAYLERCMDSNVSFAAINYPFRQTTRLDTIMLNIARAIQFLRSKAKDWNIDKNKIAAYGGSAGGGATIWLAFNDDLAEADNPDPVLRESTRLTVGGHLNSQATYDFLKWAEILDVSEDWMYEMNTTEDLELYHIPDRSWYDSTEIIELRKFLDMSAFIDPDDPPMFFQNLNSLDEPAVSGAVIHHPRHAIYLKKIYDFLDIDSFLDIRTTPQEERLDMLDFFFKYLLNNETYVEENYTKEAQIKIYPNPASEYIDISNIANAVNGRVNPAVDIKIYNFLGEKIMEVETGLRTVSTVDISMLPPGIYFVKIGEVSQKFIKLGH